MKPLCDVPRTLGERPVVVAAQANDETGPDNPDQADPEKHTPVPRRRIAAVFREHPGLRGQYFQPIRERLDLDALLLG
jgi:hypothetical protein